MDIVYFIHEQGAVKIPFYAYDNALFSRLRSCKVGFWNSANNQFVLTGELSAGLITRLLSGSIGIELNKSDKTPLVLHNFFTQLSSPDISIKPAHTPAPINPARAEQALPELFTSDWTQSLETEMHSRKYSQKTMKAYLYYNKELCRTVQKAPPDIDIADIKSYLARLEGSRNFSAASMNLIISALKFFYSVVLKKDFISEQRRPRQDKRLPSVLARSEIRQMFDAVKNPKHRLLLMLTYSSGLRVSETVALKRGQIDLARKTIFVRSGKGRKDRYTVLSEIVAKSLQEYCTLFSLSNDDWLFPGASNGSHLSIRSAQKIFDRTLEKAAIAKPASIHSLRHSFATHLLETGTDVCYIKDLLGHASIRTTERYTHVAKRDILKVRSPFDNPGGDVKNQ